MSEIPEIEKRRCEQKYEDCLKAAAFTQPFDRAVSVIYSCISEIEHQKGKPRHADIEEMRSCMIAQLGVSEIEIDKILCEAWKQDKIALESGAPIGRYIPNYLDCNGTLFWYVKERR